MVATMCSRSLIFLELGNTSGVRDNFFEKLAIFEIIFRVSEIEN